VFGGKRRFGRLSWLGAVVVMAAAIIEGSKRKFLYGWGYGTMSTIPCWMWFFVVTGSWGLGNPSLVFFGGRGIWNPCGRGREGVGGRRGGRHGGEGAGG